MTRRWLAPVLLVAGLALAGSGCAGVRQTLGTAASPCYRALPDAVHVTRGKGHLVGVRRVRTGNLEKRLPNTQPLAPSDKALICVFAFKGNYVKGDVPEAVNRDNGQYAIVALTSKSKKVVAAFLVNRLPTRFTHGGPLKGA